VSSNNTSDPEARLKRHATPEALNLARDVPTTREDVEALSRVRIDLPSWFSLTVEEFETLIPEGALERRPATSPSAREFELP
jgi:hypothetical protein